jgi:hypothetical protein
VIKLLKIVTRRVANKKIREIFDGRARTDGINVWLPLSSNQFNFDEKIGIASHEAAHIRFRSIFDPSLHASLCPENPAIAYAVINVLEDARIETLLKIAYLGFWIDLDRANLRQGLIIIGQFKDQDPAVLYSTKTVEFCLRLVGFHASGHEELIYNDALRGLDGSFLFAKKPLGAFWTKYLDAISYLKEHLTFAATVVAAKSVINALKELLNDLDSTRDDAGQAPDSCPRSSREQRSSHAANNDASDPGGGTKNEPLPDAGPRDLGGQVLDPTKFESFPDRANQVPNPVANPRMRPPVPRRPRPSPVVPALPPESSGIRYEDSDKEERKSIDEIKKKLKASGENVEKLRKSIAKIDKKEASRIKRLVEEDTDLEDDDGGGENGNGEISLVEGDEEVVVDCIDEIVKLQSFNNMENPSKEYNDIVKENYYTIKQLRKALACIKMSHQFERGARRGIISDRDLPRVVASRGKFNRPFLAPISRDGANLLILIDESASMSADETCRHLLKENSDCRCSMCETCTVLKSCPDSECCEDAGVWPKSYTLECSCTCSCPMQKRLEGEGSDEMSIDKALPIYVAKKTAIILAEALKETRIRFGVIGFSAVGGKNVIVEKVYKRLDEDVNPKKLGSIWVSFESGENRDGTSFTTIAQRHFKNVERNTPVMIIISDGQPFHGGTRYVGNYAQTMTAKAVQALRQTIRLFAISIDYEGGHEYLNNIYGSDKHVILNNPTDITDKIIYLVKDITSALH